MDIGYAAYRLWRACKMSFTVLRARTYQTGLEAWITTSRAKINFARTDQPFLSSDRLSGLQGKKALFHDIWFCRISDPSALFCWKLRYQRLQDIAQRSTVVCSQMYYRSFHAVLQSADWFLSLLQFLWVVNLQSIAMYNIGLWYIWAAVFPLNSKPQSCSYGLSIFSYSSTA